MGMLQFWTISFVLLGVLLLPLVHCSDPNLQVKDDSEHKSPVLTSNNATTNQQNVEANSGSDSAIGAPLKKEEQGKNPKEVVQNDLLKSNVNNTLEDSKNEKGKVSGDSSNMGLMNKDKGSDSIGGSKERIDSKQVTAKDDKDSGNTGGSEQRVDSKQVISKDKESGNAGGSKGDKSKQVTNDDKKGGNIGASEKNLQDDECDPSNMCIDEKKMLKACLRIPGNDSPDLSLQIWNKGRKPVTVSIAAPAFVQVEEPKVQLQPKEDKKVKVSIAYDGKDSLIFLTTEDSRCTLDFREFVPHDASLDHPGSNFNLRYHLNSWTKTHLFIFLGLTSFLVFGCAWMYFGLHKKLARKSGYQPVEMELPVSDVAKTTTVVAANSAVVEMDSGGGWDNSWDDSWDDEEAPMTPTLPTTPSVSSRGLASRRLGKEKEGWKD